MYHVLLFTLNVYIYTCCSSARTPFSNVRAMNLWFFQSTISIHVTSQILDSNSLSYCLSRSAFNYITVLHIVKHACVSWYSIWCSSVAIGACHSTKDFIILLCTPCDTEAFQLQFVFFIFSFASQTEITRFALYRESIHRYRSCINWYIFLSFAFVRGVAPKPLTFYFSFLPFCICVIVESLLNLLSITYTECISLYFYFVSYHRCFLWTDAYFRFLHYHLQGFSVNIIIPFHYFSVFVRFTLPFSLFNLTK